MTDLPIEVVKATGANLNGNAVMLTARVKVDEEAKMSAALQQLRSKNTKELVYQERYKFDLANYGVAVSGGPRPVREGDKVVAYELDFKFTRGI